MADIPEYEPTQQVSPGPLVNSAPIYEGYARIANQVEQVTRPLAQNLANQQAEKEGTIAGSDPAFRKTIPSIGEASQAFNEAALAANKQQVSADIIQNLNKFHQQAMFNNGQGVTDQSASAFSDQSKTYLNNLMATVPMQNRQLVKNLWTAKSTMLQSSLQGKLNQKQTNMMQFNFDTNHNVISGEMSASNQQGNYHYANTLRGQAIQNLKSAVEHGGMSPKIASKYEEQLEQDYVLSRAKGQVTGALNHFEIPFTVSANNRINHARADSIINSFQNNKKIQARYKNPLQLSSAVANLNQMVKQHYIQNKLEKINTDKQQKALNDQALYAGHTDTQLYNTVTSGMDPQKKAAFDNQHDMYLLAGTKIQNIKNGSLTEANQNYSDLVNAHNTINWSNPEQAESEKKVLGEVTNYAKQVIKEKVGDPSKNEAPHPMNFTQFNPAYQQVANKVEQNPQSYPDPSLTKSEAAINIQREQGYKEGQLEVLPQSSVQQNYTNMTSIANNPGELLAYIQHNLAKEVGNNPEAIGIALRQIRSYGPGMNNVAAFYSIASNPTTMGQADQVGVALQEPTRKWLDKTNVKLSDLYKKIDSRSGDYTSLLINNATSSQAQQVNQQILSYRDTIANIAAYNISKGVHKDTAINNATDLIYKNQASISHLNGNGYLVPTTDIKGNPIDKRNAAILINYTLQSAIKKGVQVPNSFESQALDQDIREKAFINHVMNTAKVQGVNGATYNFLTENNKVLRYKDGTPVELNYSDIANPNKEQESAIGIANKQLLKSSLGFSPLEDIYDVLHKHVEQEIQDFNAGTQTSTEEFF